MPGRDGLPAWAARAATRGFQVATETVGRVPPRAVDVAVTIVVSAATVLPALLPTPRWYLVTKTK